MRSFFIGAVTLPRGAWLLSHRSFCFTGHFKPEPLSPTLDSLPHGKMLCSLVEAPLVEAPWVSQPSWVRVFLRAFPLRGEDAVLLWAKGIDAELLHFFVEGGSVDPQLVGGNVPIPLIGSKDFEDDLTFGFFERLAQ